MAKSTTTRFGLQRWTANGDTNHRSEFDTSFANLASLAAGWLAPTTATNRPAASAANERFLHRASDSGQLSYSTGSTWIDIPSDGDVSSAASSAASSAVSTHAGAADPHTGYLLESAHTKAVHDALNIDADTVDGQHASSFAGSGHDHDAAYVNEGDHTTAGHNALGIDAATVGGSTEANLLARANHTGTQALSTVTGHDKTAHDSLGINADTVDGQHASAFATSGHGHTQDPPLTSGSPVSPVYGPAAAGSSGEAARQDHRHAYGSPANPGTTSSSTGTNQGSHAVPARSDHRHGYAVGSPAPLTFGVTGTAGTAASLNRSDHRHSMPDNPVPPHEAATDPHPGYLREVAHTTALHEGLGLATEAYAGALALLLMGA